jgi:glycosyltransferase involved in cell wall biosynthesis
MKIVFIDNVCDFDQPGSSGHSDMVWNIADRLVMHGQDITIIAPYSEVPFSHSKVKIIRIPILFRRHNVITNSLVAIQCAWKAKTIKADIVHATDAFSAGAAGLLKISPLAFMVSGNIYQRLASSSDIDKSAALGYRLWSKLAATKSSAVMCTSTDMRNWWKITGAKDHQLFDIPLGVDTKKFYPSEIDINQTKEDLIFLAVARFSKENNVDLLLNALAHPLISHTPFNLLIVGDGPLRDYLYNCSKELNIIHRIRWLGKVFPGDLPQVYRSADVFLFSRLVGGPPRVIVEAMASGLPIISFEGSGVDSYIRHGQNGFIAPLGDISKYAEFIMEFLSDRENIPRMGKASRQLAEDNYSWNKVINRLENIYQMILI